MEDSSFLLKFLPIIPCPFSADNIDLPHIRMRDPESILALFEDYGITLILKGLI